MSWKPEKPKTRNAPMSGALAQAVERCDAAQAPIDARFGKIDDEALADQLFTAASDAVAALAETPCANDAEFLEKLRYLLALETHIFGGPPDGRHDFGSIVIAVDRHFNADRDFSQVPIGERGVDWGDA
jgi:hypothetical protein